MYYVYILFKSKDSKEIIIDRILLFRYNFKLQGIIFVLQNSRSFMGYYRFELSLDMYYKLEQYHITKFIFRQSGRGKRKKKPKVFQNYVGQGHYWSLCCYTNVIPPPPLVTPSPPRPFGSLNMYPPALAFYQNLTLSCHHINYTKNTSLAFHRVMIHRHVSFTIEPRRRAQQACNGAPVHHEPSCPQWLYMGKFILVYMNLLCC